MIRRLQATRRGVAWLELLLLLAALALLLQLWPALGAQFLRALDIRNWSSSIKFLANLGFVLVLVGIRFGPDFLRDWRERRVRITAERAITDKAVKLKAEREAIERMQQSRRRRMY